MQRIVKQSKALLLLLAFVLVFSPLSVLADAGKTKTINYVALGDSLAKGTLNTNEPSKGYVGNIVSDLEKSGYQVNLTNEGENGFKTNDVLNGMPEITTELASADIITISVGANDVLADLIGLIKQNPDLLANFKPEYMTEVGIAQLQQEMTNAVAAAIVAESVAKVAFETAEQDVIAAKTSIDGLAALLAPLKAELEKSFFWSNIEPIIKNIEVAIDEAETSVADVENIGVDELQNASAALNSAYRIIDEAEQYFFMLPEELKQNIQLFKAQITTAATAVVNAIVSVENVVTAQSAAIQARAVADAAQLLYTNVVTLANVFGEIPEKTKAVGVNIGQILGAIKGINQTAEIYVMGYYNAIPYVDKDVVAPLLYGLNLAIQTPTDRLDATFVPTAHLFDANNYLVPNQYNIHPNEAGYAAISEVFMDEIGKSYPNIVPEKPGEKEITIGEKVNVSAGEQILINGTDVSLLLPADLPEGTTLTVTSTSDDALAKAKGLKEFGAVLNFTFEFPEGSEKYEGTFTLVMGYDKDSPDDVDIYYFNEEKDTWVSQEGKVDKESQEISLEVTHFSNYGVFAQVKEDPKDPPATEEPSDDDKTPPVTKDPTKGSDKDNKSDGKKTTTTTNGSKLPKTATNNYTLLLLGTILLVSGSASLIIMRKKRLISNEI